MKYGMPRKIDEENLKKLLLFLVCAVAMAVVAWFGYEAWMHPYRQLCGHLDDVRRDGEAFLKVFDESLASADRDGLGSARKRMAALSAVAKREPPELPDFHLDGELYTPADRMAAERLLEAHSGTVSDYAKGSEALKSAVADGDGLVKYIDRLLVESSETAIAEARLNLTQSLQELKKVQVQGRPTAAAATDAEERFKAAKRGGEELQKRIDAWTAEVQKAMADAKSIEKEMAQSKQKMKDAAESSRILREKGLSLKIDLNSPKLAVLQENLRKGERKVEAAIEAYRTAKREGDSVRGKNSEKAREVCRTAKSAIQRLVSEYGDLLPENKVKEGMNAPEELEATIRKQDETWQRLGGQGGEVVHRAESLRAEAMEITSRLERARETGQVDIDGVRASVLPSELDDTLSKLAVATTALGTEGMQRQLATIVARAVAAMKAVQAAKPDIPKLLAEIRRDAESALEKIAQIQSEKDLLENRVRDGRGVAKATLEQALTACRHPDVAEDELRKLKSAVAATGRDIQTLRVRLAKAQESVGPFAAAVGKVRQEQETAEAAGRFFPVSWEPGAIGREGPGTAGSVTEARVLIPLYSGAEGDSYEWEFDLYFESAGQHRIEVKVDKPLSRPIQPLNESIKRDMKAVHEGIPAIGGWIKVGCQLISAAGTWGDELWVPNYYNKEFSAETIVSGSGTFAAGYQTFTLGLTLDSIPATGNNGGWHPSRLKFTVFVDGKQVERFWHKAR